MRSITTPALSGTGTFVLASTTAQFTPDLSPSFSMELRSSTLAGPGDVTLVRSLLLVGGIVNSDVDLDNQSAISVIGSTSQIQGAFHNAAGSSLLVSGNGAATGTLTVANGFTNEGTITLSTAGNPFGSGDGSATLNVPSGTLVNAAGATILATKTVGQGTNSLNAALDNLGILTVDHRLIIDKPGAPYHNSGTISVASGQIFAIDNGTLTNLSAGTLTGGTYVIDGTFRFPNASIATNAANIVLVGAAARIVNQFDTNALANLATNAADGRFTIKNGHNLTTSGAFHNAGTLGVGVSSTFTASGDYTQSATAAVHVDIGGSPVSGQFGRIISSSSAALDGSLNVSLVNGFGPSQGQSYPILAFASHGGTFAATTGLHIGQVQIFEVVTNPSGVILNAIADATDLAMEPSLIDVPSTGISGEEVTISYTVRNLTDTPPVGTWFDSLYLSTDNVLDAGDPLITRVEHLTGVAARSSYNETVTTLLPGVVEDDYRVIVVSDSRGLVPDVNRANNTGVSGGVIRARLQELALGGSVSGTVEGSQDLYFRLEVPFATDVRLSANFDRLQGVDVLVLYRAVPSPANFDLVLSNQLNQSSEALLAGAAGTYYIQVHGRPENAGLTTAFDLSAAGVAFEVRSISVSRGSNVGRVTTTIAGVGFTPATVFSLVANDGTERPAVTIVQQSDRAFFATFDLVGLSPGVYSVRAADGPRSAVADDVFTVTTGGAGEFRAQLVLPSAIRNGREGVLIVEYANLGETDIAAPLLSVSSHNAIMTRQLSSTSSGGGAGGGGGSSGGASFVFQQLPPSPPPIPPKPLLQFLAISADGPAGVLPPGTRGRVEVLRFQDDGSQSPNFHAGLSFLLSVAGPADLAFDLASSKDDLRPFTVSPEAWDIIFNNLLTRIGTTVGQYVTALDEAANYLSRYGIYTSDIDRLLSLHFAQADNALPGGSPHSVIDAVAPASGALLTWGRMFAPTISRRFDSGILGRGWSHPWDLSLSRDAETTDVLIRTPGGTRRFVEQLDGSFVSSLLDPAQLTLHGGIFSLRESNGTVSRFDEPTGRLLDIADRNGHQVTLNYTADKLVSLVHSNGDQFDFSYNLAGRLTQLTDQAERVTTYEYDAAGEHLTKVTGPDGVWEYGYETTVGARHEHAFESVTRPDGTHLFYEYDGQGRLVRTSRDGDAEAVTLTYGNAGEVFITDALTDTTSLFFSDFGQLLETRNARDRSARFDYDAVRRLDRVTRPQDTVSLYDFDDNGNLTIVVKPDGGSLSFTYDTTFNLPTTIRDAQPPPPLHL